MRFLLVDRILEHRPRAYIRGERLIREQETWLCQDALGEWCFIPSLMGEALGQLAAWDVMSALGFACRPVAGVVSAVHFAGVARPGDRLMLESFIDELDERAVAYHSIARVGEKEVFRLEGALGPMLPMAEFIRDAEVRAQYEDLHRDGQELQSGESPLPARFLHPDAILEAVPGKSLSATWRIPAEAPWFADHFPCKPVLPLTILLECSLNLARDFLARSGFSRYLLQSLRRIKMNAFVPPGDTLTLEARLKSHDDHQLVLDLKTYRDGKRICASEALFASDSQHG